MSYVIDKATYEYVEKSTRRIGFNADFVAGGNFNVFQIQNGCVQVASIFGHVTTAFTGAVPTILLRFTPTLGAGISSISTVSVGFAHARGTLLTWNGTLAGVLTPYANGWSDSGPGAMLFIPGIISVTNGGGADATAAIDWYIRYRPAAPEATVVAL